MSPPRAPILRTYRRMVALLLRIRPLAFFAYWALALVGAGFPAVQALILARLFETGGAYAAGQGSLTALAAAAGLYAAVEVAQGVFNMARKLGIESLQRSLVAGLNQELFAKTARIRLEAFERPGFYDQMSRARSAIDSRRFLNQMRRAAFSVESALTAVGLAAVLIRFSPWLAVSLALAAVPSAVLRLVRGRQFYDLHFFHSPRERVLGYYAGVLRGPAEAKEVRVARRTLGLRAQKPDP